MSNAFETFLEVSGKIPPVRISREDFLKNTFYKKEPRLDKLQKIVESGPLAAGIPKEKVDKIADSIISNTVLTASLTSFASGIPGGFFMVATIPADITQLYGHILVLIQKLLYLYGYKEDVFDDGGQLDDGTKLMITLILGSILGIEAANTFLKQLSIHAAKIVAEEAGKTIVVKGSFLITNKIANRVASKIAPTVVKNIAAKIAAKTSTKTILGIASKSIPVLSGVVSGAITAATLKPMTKRLKKLLSEESMDFSELEVDNNWG